MENSDSDWQLKDTILMAKKTGRINFSRIELREIFMRVTNLKSQGSYSDFIERAIISKKLERTKTRGVVRLL